MSLESIENRMGRLEQRVTALERLPERIGRLELQILHLRDEMRVEFSATREGILAGDQDMLGLLRDEIRAGDEETRRVLRDEIRAGDEETRRVLRDEIRAGDEETRRVLRDEIRDGNTMIVTTLIEQVEEVRRHGRVMFEELVSRISTIREARSGPD